MKSYLKYILVIFFALFSFYYTDKVIELSNYNDTILTSINDYASIKDTKCREGMINSDGVILGLSGINVDKNKSYSNMKGIGFKEELIEYKIEECILNKENNLDKYIISGNKYKNNVSLVINVINGKYYENMISLNENINLLVNVNMIEKLDNKDNLLFKGNKEEFKIFRKNIDNFYCVKVDNDVIDFCKKYKVNSIKPINFISKDLLSNVKKILENGIIIFIDENSYNLNEFGITINYIKSRGYNIVNINQLLD